MAQHTWPDLHMQHICEMPASEGLLRRTGAGSGFEVVRYHSLAVEQASLPACLQPIAWTCGAHHALRDSGAAHPDQLADRGRTRPGPGLAETGSCVLSGGAVKQGGVLMAVAHCARPHLGVQFHPESIATAYGAALLRNFRAFVDAYHCRGVPRMNGLHSGES